MVDGDVLEGGERGHLLHGLGEGGLHAEVEAVLLGLEASRGARG